MDVTPLVREGLQIVQAYSEEGFRVSGKSYNGAVLVSPNETIDFGVEDFSDLNKDSFQKIIDQKDQIDVLLIGAGKQISFLEPNVQNYLNGHELYPDMMDTGAACRTFNVLVAEGRRVFAVLFMNV